MAASFLAPILNKPEIRWTLRNERAQAILASTVECAFDSTSRNKGLLGRDSMAAGSALILAPCSSIHTFFMRFPIDVLFVARDGHVTKMARALAPWRICIGWRAFAVVELPAGACEPSGTRIGDRLALALE